MPKYHLGKGTVLNILEQHGVSGRNQPLTPDQCTEAIELYLSGWCMARVGRHYGRAHTVIRDLLRKRGIQR
jgi:ribosome modulation factor